MERTHSLCKDVIVTHVIWDSASWAKETFESCELGDVRRNQRLVKLAEQMAARPASSIPDQTETWGDCKAAYRFFDTEDVTFYNIIQPHCRMTRESSLPGDTTLIICDTTELDYSSLQQTKGLRPIGNGHGRGFFLHSALMIDAGSSRIEGLAGQEIFYRPAKKIAKNQRHARRRDANRESAVWGRLIDQVGRPPANVKWVHLCDRAADDVEVMWKAVGNGCGFVIRASRLNRNVKALDGTLSPLHTFLQTLSDRGHREISVRATKKMRARTADVTMRYGTVDLPLPRILSPWLKRNRPSMPMRLGVVELVETNPPKGCEALHWVLYSESPIASQRQAEEVIWRYEQRPTIEDFHKALKTGCGVEDRQLQTADRLERIVALCSVVAVRLMQLKTAARETPDRPAKELVPARWIQLLLIARKRPFDTQLTIRDFVRQLAGLGGFLLRRHDGEPGWITLWRGFEKLQLMIRGADAEKRRNRTEVK